MKKLSFILLLIPLCTYAQNDTVGFRLKAIKLVTKYLATNLNDPKSYEPVRFSIVVPAYSDLSSLKEYQRLDLRLTRLRTQVEYQKLELYDAKSKKDLNIKKAALVDTLALTAKFQLKFDSLKNSYKPKQIGWRIVHEFRAKNPFNALILHSTVFFFDREIASILKDQDITQ